MSNRRGQDTAEPLDPIALTLAVWLGLIVAVTGLIRLSDDAAAQAALAQASAPSNPTTATPDPMPFATRVMAFGG